MSWNSRHPVAHVWFIKVLLRLLSSRPWRSGHDNSDNNRNLNSYRSSHGVWSTKSCPRPSKSPANSGKPGALKGTNLRGSDRKYRESLDKLKKSKILITCQRNTFGELSSKILLKPSGILLFTRNSEKRFCLINYAKIRFKIKQIKCACL